MVGRRAPRPGRWTTRPERRARRPGWVTVAWPCSQRGLSSTMAPSGRTPWRSTAPLTTNTAAQVGHGQRRLDARAPPGAAGGARPVARDRAPPAKPRVPNTSCRKHGGGEDRLGRGGHRPSQPALTPGSLLAKVGRVEPWPLNPSSNPLRSPHSSCSPTPPRRPTGSSSCSAVAWRSCRPRRNRCPWPFSFTSLRTAAASASSGSASCSTRTGSPC